MVQGEPVMGVEVKKGTLVYIGGFELPDKNAAAHRVLNNGKVLRELGYEVVFIGIRHDIQDTIIEEYQGFTCWSIPYPVGTIQWVKYLGSTKILKQVLRQLEDVKGIIFYNYQALALARGMYICKKSHIWSIVDVTEWYVASKSNPLFWAIKQLDTTVRMRFLHKRTDGIIVISRFLHNYYKSNSKRCVLQLPPLIDKEEEKWSKKIVRENRKHIQLIYAGSTSDMKDNLGVDLEAIAPYRDKIHMQIIGINTYDLQRLLSGEQYEKCVGEHVKICGRKSHIECLDMLKKSDFQIFVRPNNLVTQAGFPTKLGESFACGTPVITNRSSNIDDYLMDGINGFFVKEMDKEKIGYVIEKITQMAEPEILRMKSYCENINLFDYHTYIEEMQKFLSNIE